VDLDEKRDKGDIERTPTPFCVSGTVLENGGRCLDGIGLRGYHFTLPTKIGFNANAGWELGWKDSVDNTGRFSAAFSGFARVIFFS
jgi:hypothetical protein